MLEKVFANRYTTSLFYVFWSTAFTALLAIVFLLISGDVTWGNFTFVFTLCTLWFSAPAYIAAIINLIPVFKDPEFGWYCGVYYGGLAISVFCHKYLKWPDLDSLLAGCLIAPAICQIIWYIEKAQAKKREDELRSWKLERENEELKRRIAELTDNERKDIE